MDIVLERFDSADLEEYAAYLRLKAEYEKDALDAARLKHEAEARMNR